MVVEKCRNNLVTTKWWLELLYAAHREVRLEHMCHHLILLLQTVLVLRPRGKAVRVNRATR